MNNMLKYTKMLLLFVLVLGLTSCDSEEETEYNLPGEWYTSEEIDFGAYTWGRGITNIYFKCYSKVIFLQ